MRPPAERSEAGESDRTANVASLNLARVVELVRVSRSGRVPG